MEVDHAICILFFVVCGIIGAVDCERHPVDPKQAELERAEYMAVIAAKRQVTSSLKDPELPQNLETFSSVATMWSAEP